jgi:MFS family permease
MRRNEILLLLRFKTNKNELKNSYKVILYNSMTQESDMTTQTMRNVVSRDFILASSVQFALAFVFSILIPTLPIYLSQSGSKEVEIGVLTGILAVSSLILRPLVGKALLRIPEQVFMTAGALLYAITSVAYLFTPPFWPFLIVRVFHGIGVAFASTALFTLIANISPQAHRGQSLSYFFLTYNFAGALAPPLGMFLINQFSFTVLFLVCSGLSLGALFMTHQLGRRKVAPLQDSSVEDGFLLSRKALAPSIINFFFFFTWGALTAFFPLYAINHGVANPGFFFTTVAVMLILGRTLGGKIFDLHSRERIILPCLFAYIIFDGRPGFFQNATHVYSGCGDLGDWACLFFPFFGGLCSWPCGFFSGSSDGNVYSSHGFGVDPRTRDHGPHPPCGQLSDHVPLFSSDGYPQYQLFLFFRQKEGMILYPRIFLPVIVDPHGYLGV